MKQKLTEIEDQMLETCIVLTGLHEDKWEDAEPRRVLIDKELSVIAPGESDEERLANVNAIKIEKTERIGCYNPPKADPSQLNSHSKVMLTGYSLVGKISIKAYL